MKIKFLSSLLLLFATSTTVTAAATSEVCLEGYVIDTFCLGVGFFPHVTTRSLHYPEVHSVHCMIDDVPCIGGGFEMVIPTNEAMAVEVRAAQEPTSPYCRAYKFDKAGNDMVIEVAKSTGVCDDCYNNTTGEWVRGFRVTVFGNVSSPATAAQPAILAVTDVQHSSVGCDESHGGNVLPLQCVAERDNLMDIEAPCWEEDQGCRNLDDPFTKPTSPDGNLPAHEVPPAETTTEAEDESSSSNLRNPAALIVVGLLALLVH